MQPEEQAENNAELEAPAEPFRPGTQRSFKATDWQIHATFLPASLQSPLALSMPNHSFFKGTEDGPQTQKSQSPTWFPNVSEPLLSGCVRGARCHGELLVGQGCLGQIAGRQRDLFYPSFRATDERAACVLPETLMLGCVRGWVALEWADAGSGSRLFLLIIIYITIIPSPSSSCSPRLWICAISGTQV